MPARSESPGYLDQLQGGGEWDRVAQGLLTLKKGSRGGAVSHLQKLLNQNGARIAVDGDFGRRTESAVRQAQKRLGVGVDGKVGPKTVSALGGGGGAAGRARAERPAPEEGREARDAARGGGAGGGAQERQQAPARQRRSERGGPQINVRPGQFEKYGLRSEVLANALEVFRNAWRKGDTKKMTYSIIDFSMPSVEKRLFVIDLKSGKMLFNELVTHGGKSGGNMTTSFSNRSGSNKSSMGLSRTAETYYSSKFRSTALRIDGLEKGYNDNMRKRAVVMHQASYATQGAVDANGGSRLGRSQGCPAIDPKVAGKVIDTIKNGCLIYSYYPDPKYMQNSEYQ